MMIQSAGFATQTRFRRCAKPEHFREKSYEKTVNNEHEFAKIKPFDSFGAWICDQFAVQNRFLNILRDLNFESTNIDFEHGIIKPLDLKFLIPPLWIVLLFYQVPMERRKIPLRATQQPGFRNTIEI